MDVDAKPGGGPDSETARHTGPRLKAGATKEGASSPHWALAYLGREAGCADGACADFVRQVMAERFGRRVALPAPGTSLRARDAQIAAAARALAEPTDDPHEGDAVTMRARGRRRALGHHVGVWCAPGGQACVLHLCAGLGARLDPLDDGGRALAACGLEATGVYRWL